ncbi:MAG TPA: hypothetical protein VGO40_07085 [Longimicrobium sp.]|jgi:hypothetical protein|nr:hypothetical protein [Longimicrobium sp.]
MTMKAQPEDRDDGEKVIADVRAARHRISERFGHDPYKLVAHYMERQKSHPERLIRAPDSKEDKSAA